MAMQTADVISTIKLSALFTRSNFFVMIRSFAGRIEMWIESFQETQILPFESLFISDRKSIRLENF